jgi:hypothetical protein
MKNYIVKKLNEDDILEILIEHYYGKECFHYPNAKAVMLGEPDKDLRFLCVFSTANG